VSLSDNGGRLPKHVAVDILVYYVFVWPVPMAARSKAWFSGRSLPEITDSDLAWAMDVCVVSVVCCQVEVSATGRAIVQRSPTDCGASECDREA